MKGDFTRDTFDSFRHFSRVLMQQGRVQLDADFNEQAAILLHYLRTLATDLIGPYGGPAHEYGFKINFNGDGKLIIGGGRYYVDGILCENFPESDNDLLYEKQAGFKPGLPDWPQPEAGKDYFAYLDVWERHIAYVQTDCIREVALGGPDTCTRAEVVWQLKLEKVENGNRCSDAETWVNSLPKLSNTSMKAWVQPEREYANPCSISPESRYRGLENQLYRIEIHRGGQAWDGIKEQSSIPAGNAGKAATFKWSRDNGSVVFPIVRQQGNVVTLQSLGQDKRTSLEVGDWVEIMDDGIELRGEPGILAEVDKVDSVEMTVMLKLPSDQPPNSVSWPDYNEKSLSHPLLRWWDQRAIEGLAMSEGAILIHESGEANNGWIEIEDGIEVQFQHPPAENDPPCEYRTGDYWLVPARVATGEIEWPTELDEEGNEVSKALPPDGIEHHYAPLAVIINQDIQPTDCRCPIEPLCPKKNIEA